MSNIISDSVSKLSAITDQTPIDWDAFDSVLKGLEDINAYDEHDEETILSEFIMDGEFYKRGFILADVVRHFLACGYDVSANDGLNGGLALHSLCWSSYDHYVLEAAKVLMNAGAPVKYRTSGDDPNEEPECLLGSIGWKISGAWMVDKDYAWANILEAYYAMTEANIAGKDYNTISLPPSRKAYENISCSIKPYISLTQSSYFSRVSRCSAVIESCRRTRFLPISLSSSLTAWLLSLLCSWGFIFPYQNSSSMLPISHLLAARHYAIEDANSPDNKL